MRHKAYQNIMNVGTDIWGQVWLKNQPVIKHIHEQFDKKILSEIRSSISEHLFQLGYNPISKI